MLLTAARKTWPGQNSGTTLSEPTTLRAIEASLPSLRNQHQEYVEAAIQNIEACKEKLRFVASLRLELIDSTTSTSKLRLETGKKRLMYPFRRPKLQQLAQSLQQANDLLELTLTGFNL